MLALPLQAVAAAGMLGCMTAQQAAIDAMPMMGEMHSGCHDEAPADTSHAPHDCKHCAACALAAALPIPPRDTLAPLPATPRFTLPAAATFSGFIPDGLERPPRSTCA